jgi:hypothetical protein
MIKANKMAIVKGKNTFEPSFNTAPTRIQQISSNNEKIARPE